MSTAYALMIAGLVAMITAHNIHLHDDYDDNGDDDSDDQMTQIHSNHRSS